MSNVDQNTVLAFGDEWSRFDQEALKDEEHEFLFGTYFHMFPWEALPVNAQGFDMDCGSGLWAKLVAPKVISLTCIDSSPEALAVAQSNLQNLPNVNFQNSGVSDQTLPQNS